jgi:hypothetical protein
MATVDEFMETAGQIVKESGFEFVTSPEPGYMAAIRSRQSSVLMKFQAREAGNGDWLFLITAVAVTNFERPDAETTLELLTVLSALNRDRYFGTWYYSPEEPAIVLDHTLLAEHMSAEELAKIVKDIEAGADAVDDKLSSFVQGETAIETLEKAAREHTRTI